MAFEHTPVLLQEVLTYLDPQPGGVVVDATLGGAGHARHIVERLGGNGRFLGMDQDPVALSAAEQVLKGAPPSVMFCQANFRDLPAILSDLAFPKLTGLLLDVGVSSPQVDNPARGFSYWEDGPLDMRMNPSMPDTAADLVNTLPESELRRLLKTYGEEPWAARIAKFIVSRRAQRPIERTLELVEVVKSAVPAGARRDGPHPARRTFQALRIAVNDELAALQSLLQQLPGLLAPGGRVVVIAFHSLEDRLVKQSFQQYARGEPPILEILTKRPVFATADEVEHNARARSARLRAAMRTDVPF